MKNLRKIVGVGLAVALVAALAVYVLLPKAGTTTNSVVVNEPQNPTSGGTDSTTTGGHGTGGTGHGGTGAGSTPTPSTPPPTKPPKAHGQNSHGPKHVICLPEKSHPGNGISQYQGANQYRGQCPVGSAYGAQGHGHHDATTSTSNVATVQTLFYVAPTGGIYGVE